jgi:hypothetical protein
MKASKNWVVQKALLGWKPNPRAESAPKNSVNKKMIQCGARMQIYRFTTIRSHLMRSDGYDHGSFALVRWIWRPGFKLGKKAKDRRGSSSPAKKNFPVTTPVTGVQKTSPNRANHTWFCSFFHKDHEYEISFQRNIIETQKRSKQVSKIKTTTLRLTRIEPKQLPRKHQNMKWSWMVSRFTWIGLCNVRFELTLLLATVTLLCFNSLTFLSEKWVILASGCVVNVFEGIDFVFKWEFLILEFWEMKKNGASLCYCSCAVFCVSLTLGHWNWGIYL